MSKKGMVLGISASLRNARWGFGNRDFIEALKGLQSEEELNAFLKVESEQHLENFMEAGRRDNKGFLEIYDNLKKAQGNRGLSNSEVALGAGLWSAHQLGTDIDCISLAEYFTATGGSRNLEELKSKLRKADGLLISGPVYFGDRGSLAHSLIELIRDDEELRKTLYGKYYAGITVGAKRNGGQETTLIYQMLDMVRLGMLAVGNDSETTSQYGGTGHAGDVGTMHKDTYGLWTSMGVGRRIGHVVKMGEASSELEGPVKTLFLILQDADKTAVREINSLLEGCGPEVEATVLDVTEKDIMRCLACDICPTHIDLDSVYRCIVKAKSDEFSDMHESLLNYDAIIPVTTSVADTKTMKSNYQIFVERTRYLRRGDYIFTDLLTAPLTFEELGVREYYDIRLLTSMIRHHTIMAKPMNGYLVDGAVMNRDQIKNEFQQFIRFAKRVTSARLANAGASGGTKYNPTGYILSARKDLEDQKMKKREAVVQDRQETLTREAGQRLKKSSREQHV